MNVEKLKITIWAAQPERAVKFYQDCFEGSVIRQNPHITELNVAGGLIAIHGGGEGKQNRSSHSEVGLRVAMATPGDGAELQTSIVTACV